MKKEIQHEAIFTIYGLPQMDTRKVKRVVQWMRTVAENIEKNPKEFSGRFSARFMKK